MTITLAISAPPAAVLACVLFLCAAVVAGTQRAWPVCLITAGLAVAAWPW